MLLAEGGFSVFSGRTLGHHLTFEDVARIYGTTYKPAIKKDQVLVSHIGIKFIFKYPDEIEEIQRTQSLKNVPSKLQKVIIEPIYGGQTIR